MVFNNCNQVEDKLLNHVKCVKKKVEWKTMEWPNIVLWLSFIFVNWQNEDILVVKQASKNNQTNLFNNWTNGIFITQYI
jgi:hypothetical protein